MTLLIDARHDDAEKSNRRATEERPSSASEGSLRLRPAPLLTSALCAAVFPSISSNGKGNMSEGHIRSRRKSHRSNDEGSYSAVKHGATCQIPN